jgi:uncharacterized protein
VLILLTIAALYALLAFGASRSIYFPARYPAGNWSAGRAAGARDVFIRDTLHGWFIPAPDSDVVTLHLHGNAGNITHRLLSAEHIVAAGSSVLLLDYRGYGRSAGRPAERGLYEDAQAAYDWLAQRGHARIVAHGESLGTAVATELALRRPCAGLVLEAPFTSARAVAAKALPLLGPLLVYGFDTKSKLPRVRVPVLIVHGDRDEVLDYAFGVELHQIANEPKTFWTVRNATHNDLHLVAGAEFPERLRRFYASLRRETVRHPL